MGFLVANVSDNLQEYWKRLRVALSLVPLASGRRLRFSYRRHPAGSLRFALPVSHRRHPACPEYEGSAVEGSLSSALESPLGADGMTALVPPVCRLLEIVKLLFVKGLR